MVKRRAPTTKERRKSERTGGITRAATKEAQGGSSLANQRTTSNVQNIQTSSVQGEGAILPGTTGTGQQILPPPGLTAAQSIDFGAMSEEERLTATGGGFAGEEIGGAQTQTPVTTFGVGGGGATDTGGLGSLSRDIQRVTSYFDIQKRLDAAGSKIKIAAQPVPIGGVPAFARPNPKNIKLATDLATKVFSAKTIGILASIGTAVGSVFLGLWGAAEGPEAIEFPMRDALKQAQISGDWTTYWAAAEARDELLNLSTWEQLGLYTPLISPFIGIPIKIEGIRQNAILMDTIATNEQIAQENGETFSDQQIRVAEQKAQMEKELIDYFNEQREIMLELEKEAAREEREESAAFWKKHAQDMFKLEEEERKRVAEFWENYSRMKMDLNTPSKLNFGLL